MYKVPKKGSLLNFRNILRKSIATAFVFYCDAKQILYWVPVMFIVTCFWEVAIKNGHGLLYHGTLKSAVSLESELIK